MDNFNVMDRMDIIRQRVKTLALYCICAIIVYMGGIEDFKRYVERCKRVYNRHIRRKLRKANTRRVYKKFIQQAKV